MARKLILNAIEVINGELDKIEEAYNSAVEKQSILDNLKNDIEHEIELEKLSGSEMMVKYKELQACLRLRRKYKDDLEYLLSIRVSLNLSHTKSASKKVSEIDDVMSNKKYKIRIQQEVREEVLKEVSSIS